MKENNKIKILIIAIAIVISSVCIYKFTIAPKLYDKYLNTGIKYLTNGEYEEAILAFDKAIKIERKNTEARVYQAKAYIGNEELDNAVEVLEEAQNIDITNENLLKEILEILNEIDSDIAYEFLNRFIEAVGKDNISQEIKDILSSAYEFPSEPIVDPEPGTYVNGISIKLKQDKLKVGHSYYYTLDGSHPNKESNKYRGQIKISETKTIKLIGYNRNNENTEVITFDYIIDESILNEIKESISIAEDLINKTQEGEEIGNCIEGSKEPLIKSVNKTKKSLNQKVISYDEAIKIKENIDKTIDDFKYNIIEKTDKKELEDTILSAQKLHDSAVEGNNEGQYEIGAKSYLANILKEAKDLNNSILAKQDEIDGMVDKINNAKKEFENKKVKAMPDDLGAKYLSRIRYEESKANAVYEDSYSCMADIRCAASDEAQAYNQILKEIYIDLNKYLPSSKKQEIASNKQQFENEKNEILRGIEAYVEEAYKEFGPGSLGTSFDGGESRIGELAKTYALNLINKYMK